MDLRHNAPILTPSLPIKIARRRAAHGLSAPQEACGNTDYDSMCTSPSMAAALSTRHSQHSTISITPRRRPVSSSITTAHIRCCAVGFAVMFISLSTIPILPLWVLKLIITFALPRPSKKFQGVGWEYKLVPPLWNTV